MRALFLLLTLLVAIASPAHAQTIRVGQTVTGELTADDEMDSDEVPVDVWRFRATAGGTYRVTLRSFDFDAFLEVGRRADGDCSSCQSDDDSGGGLNAQVVFPAPERGTYEIRARSLAGGEGRYELSLEDAGALLVDTLPVNGATDTAVAYSADTVGVYPIDAPLVVPEIGTPVGGDSLGMDDDGITVVQVAGLLLPGMPVTGVLGPGDARGESGAYAEAWDYRGLAGETVTALLSSSDFDALLVVGRWSEGVWEELAMDDDNGAGTDSELVFTFDADGTYLFQATGFDPGATGSYTLELRSAGGSGASPADTTVSPSVPLAYGQPVHDRLRGDEPTVDGRYVDLYRFHGRAGETVTLTLRSDDFDAYLFLAPASTGEKLASDDDGGGDRDSRITVTLPEAGEYLLRATSFVAGQRGSYTLLLERE